MITDTDIKKMKKVFATKDDLKSSIRQELVAQKPEWVREITESITNALGKKIDKMYVKLDKFIGDIETKRTEQTLHDGNHQVIDRRLTRLEKHNKLLPFVD